jgi:hypothetical protein
VEVEVDYRDIEIVDVLVGNREMLILLGAPVVLAGKLHPCTAI